MISIKTPEEINLMTLSGKINWECHKYLEEKIKEGITTKELSDEAASFIRKKGGIPSFLGFEGFPDAICASINDEVVHGIPSKRKLQNGDIISIDIGVIYNGFHSDSAHTYIVGKTSKENELLLSGTKEALYAGLSKVKEGIKIGDISASIEAVAKKYNLGVVRELVGHGVGRGLHEAPDIPNYGKKDTGITLKAGMTIAIEPMFTSGKKDIWILDNGWTITTQDGSNAAHYEHTVLVTKDGFKILTGE